MINNQNGLGFAIATLKAQMEECFQSSRENGFQLEFYTQLSVNQMGE